jgi:hypothetical protein
MIIFKQINTVLTSFSKERLPLMGRLHRGNLKVILIKDLRKNY